MSLHWIKVFSFLLLAWLLLACSGSDNTGLAEPADSHLQTADALQVFGDRCAGCHADPANKRAADLSALAKLGSTQVAFAMTNGVMKQQAEGLGIDQVLALTEFIVGDKPPYKPAPEHYCNASGNQQSQHVSIDTTPIVGRWAVDSRSTFSLPAGASSIAKNNVEQLTLAWAFGLPDVANARSQPVVTGNTLFVAATSGHLFALDTLTACIRWHQPLTASPRTALTLGRAADQAVLFFGDGDSHMNAVNLHSGELVWRKTVTVSEHSMLTGAPVQHEDQLIVPVSMYEVGLAANPNYQCCRSHGGVVALDANTGAEQWAFHTTEPATAQGLSGAGVQQYGPSGAPVWSTPTVDGERGLVYVGTGQNASLPTTDLSDAVVALDLNTGEKIWHFQTIAGDAYNVACDQQPPGPNCPKWPGPDHDIGAPIVMAIDARGKDRLVVGQKSGDVYALDPDSAGQVIWRRRVGAGSALGGVHWALAVADGVIYAPVADPPFPLPHYRPEPGLYAMSLESGRAVWAAPVQRGCDTNLYEYFGRSTVYPDCSFYFGLSAAPLVVNNLVFAPALDGSIRAFDRANGEVRWKTSTAKTFESVNGVPTHGGSIDVAGVQVAGDMLFVQSGYGQFGQLPGNALLGFRLTAP